MIRSYIGKIFLTNEDYITMRRLFSFGFFSILLTFWMNVTLHAIGGKGVEEVSDEDVKNKGILKIQRNDGGIGTAVLFKEGKGQLGLSAKHLFDKFHHENNPISAHLGTEQRKVVKVYYPSNNTDLVLFVLQDPFKEASGFPSLPDTTPETSTYSGSIYGYGRTTSPNNNTIMDNSSGKCRKGKVIATHFHQIEDKSQQFLKLDDNNKITDFSLKNIIFSFAIFQNTLERENKQGNEAKYTFTESLVANRYLTVEDSNLSLNRLITSPCFTLFGDSGGPLISDDNQLYAICHRGDFEFQGGIYVDLSENLQKGKNFAGFTIKFGEDILNIGFYNEDSSKLYVGFPSQTILKLQASAVNEFLKENISQYFLRKSEFFQNLLQREKEKLPQQYFSEWLTRYHLYNSNYYVSILCQRAWVERAMQPALKYVAQQSKK